MAEINQESLPTVRETSKPQPIHCNDCCMTMIQRVPCHEHGCPNSGKEWDVIGECWVSWINCPSCELTIREGEECVDCEYNDSEGLY